MRSIRLVVNVSSPVPSGDDETKMNVEKHESSLLEVFSDVGSTPTASTNFYFDCSSSFMRSALVPQNLKRRMLKDSLRKDEPRDTAFQRIIRSIPRGKVSTYGKV